MESLLIANRKASTVGPTTSWISLVGRAGAVIPIPKTANPFWVSLEGIGRRVQYSTFEVRKTGRCWRSLLGF